MNAELTESAERAEELREALKADCARMRKVDSLPAADRAGKYRKAIAELSERLRKNGEELLRMTIFGNFCVPLQDRAFMVEWLQGWLKTETVQARIRDAGERIRRGDLGAFEAIALALREEESKIICKYGGYAYGNS